ncbi:GNAT family N-acetyltransferase [Halocatena halophila]|uniref:GNAT family N-acetyltransferase n=1 Tax=Halocatena halophila TaxID=2814576 RepID=UPI002ED4EE07
MIRSIQPDDRGRVVSLQQSLLSSPWPALLELALEQPTDESPLCLVAVASEHSAPIGYVLAIDGGRDDDDTGCYVAEIAVEPSHRRDGHATALLKAVATRTVANELTLSARADDEAALAFYRANDFELVERKPNEYDDEVDGLLLKKQIVSP